MELFLENIAKDAMDPSTYQYFKGLQDRRIVFNDEVDDRIVESVMLPLLEMDNDGSGKPITIVLNTCGGSLFDGMPLCDIIDNLKTPTTILVTGHAYSMGGYFPERNQEVLQALHCPAARWLQLYGRHELGGEGYV